LYSPPLRQGTRASPVERPSGRPASRPSCAGGPPTPGAPAVGCGRGFPSSGCGVFLFRVLGGWFHHSLPRGDTPLAPTRRPFVSKCVLVSEIPPLNGGRTFLKVDPPRGLSQSASADGSQPAALSGPERYPEPSSCCLIRAPVLGRSGGLQSSLISFPLPSAGPRAGHVARRLTRATAPEELRALVADPNADRSRFAPPPRNPSRRAGPPGSQQ